MSISTGQHAAVDPATLFHPGRVLCAHGPHGTVLRASVSPNLQLAVGATSVAVKVIAVHGDDTTSLDAVIDPLTVRAKSPLLARYIGVWPAPGRESWVVSELLERGSAKDVLSHATHAEIEPAVAYITQQALHALHFLHTDVGMAHGDVRPGNMLIDDEAHVKLSDYGVYDVLARAMKHRQCYPGAKLWPPPKKGGSSAERKSADVWALGVAVVELVEGSASVARTRRSGRRVPRCTRPGNWSVQLNQFVAGAAVLDARYRASAAELLRHRFVASASRSVLLDVVHRAMGQTSRSDQGEAYDRTNVVENLYRSNTVAMRIPLIHADDIPVDAFAMYRQRKSMERPGIEQSLWLVSDNLKNLVDMGRVESKTKIMESSTRVSQWLNIANRTS